MRIIDLFSGIGGFSLAGHWAGFETALFCERDVYCQRVLRHHFPEVPIYNDVTNLLNEIDVQEYIQNADNLILTGGFPCQPFSAAGKRQGTEDDRHLWPAMFEIIKTIKPKWVIGENVGGLLTISDGLVFEQVCADLESEGYEVQAFIIPACAKNAPHRRDRVWIVANSVSERCGGRPQETRSNFNEKRTVYTDIGHDRDGVRSEVAGCGGTSADTGLLGQKKRQQQTMGFKQLRKSEFTPNTPGERYIQRGKTDNRPGKDEEPDRFTEEDSLVDTDTASIELQRRCDSGIIRSERQGREQRFTDMGCFPRPDWENFPATEPTIRTGNDGLPGGLVDITFSKWRREAIKMLGNSIVPQVAYEIFTAIKHIEEKQK